MSAKCSGYTSPALCTNIATPSAGREEYRVTHLSARDRALASCCCTSHPSFDFVKPAQRWPHTSIERAPSGKEINTNVLHHDWSTHNIPWNKWCLTTGTTCGSCYKYFSTEKCFKYLSQIFSDYQALGQKTNISKIFFHHHQKDQCRQWPYVADTLWSQRQYLKSCLQLTTDKVITRPDFSMFIALEA
jgi:hypothetical protein